MLVRYIIIFVLWSLAFPLYAASFDCTKATTETEKAICNEPYLQRLDEILSDLYFLKASIDLPQIAFETDDPTYRSGKFSKTDTRKEQLDWINNIRAKCFDTSVCLTKSYLDRISSFYNNLSEKPNVGWTISETIVLGENSTRITIWVMDPNSYDNDTYSSYKQPFQTIYFLVTVHDLRSGKLISYNPNLIAPMDFMSWAGKEIDLHKSDEFSFEIMTSEMVGAYMHTTSHQFTLSNDEVNLRKYQYTNLDRRSHEEERRVLNLDKKQVEFAYAGETKIRKVDLVSLPLSKASVSKIESIVFVDE
jgi:uncharacterized protein